MTLCQRVICWPHWAGSNTGKDKAMAKQQAEETRVETVLTELAHASKHRGEPRSLGLMMQDYNVSPSTVYRLAKQVRELYAAGFRASLHEDNKGGA